MALLFAALVSQSPSDSTLPEVLVPGHWLDVRGSLEEDGGVSTFVASRAELLEPEDTETLTGTLRASTSGELSLLGRAVSTTAETKYVDLEPDELPGSRVFVAGLWDGDTGITAERIAARGAGRDRLSGRIDSVTPVDGGFVVTVQGFRVFLEADLEIELEVPFAEIPLGDPRPETPDDRDKDPDDQFGRGIRITEDLRFTAQVTGRSEFEENYDLDDSDAEDEEDHELLVRARFGWDPTPWLSAVAEVRQLVGRSLEEDEDAESTSRTRLGETYFYARDVFGPGVDVQVGRQDFDDEREWIYDQNLDAVRLIADRKRTRIELAAATTLDGGSDRDESSVVVTGSWMRKFRRKEAGLWFLRRDVSLGAGEDNLHLGVRALGRWLPDTECWLDASLLRGDEGGVDLDAWGYDVGATWEPEFAEPFSFTLGYALGRGDGDPTDGVDEGFHQTGLQDNNAKFSGVTSFKYYGEIFDPELANLGVFTAGIGLSLPRRTSLDLVFHDYRQDVAQASIRDADIDAVPSGNDPDLGRELDLIFGCRRWERWDLEIVGAWFSPGDAFTDDDDAYLAKLQLRYRL